MIGTIAVDGILLLAMVLLARGLALREVFALRRPASWSDAFASGATALGAIWIASLVLEATIGHGSREQSVPRYYDAARLAPFVANGLVIALYVPLVEEATWRGIGFYLLQPWGERAAIAGSAIAFAFAHSVVFDLPWVLVTGLALAALRARTRSLFPSFGLHATVNGVAILAAGLLGGP